MLAIFIVFACALCGVLVAAVGLILWDGLTSRKPPSEGLT
jgi:hypothetical protein